MAIDHQAPQDFVKRKLRELSALEEMNRQIHATVSLDALLQTMVEKAVIGVNFERGLIYLLEDDFLRCVAFLDRIRKEKGSTIKNWVGFRMDEPSIEVVSAKEGQTQYVRDALSDRRMSKKFLEVMDYHEYCVVPLKGRTGVLGVLTADKFYSRQPVFPEDIEALELFAGHISLAVENARLFKEKEAFSRQLEDKVTERTTELAQANRSLSDKMQELETLFDMSRLLSRSLELPAVLDHILAMVDRLGYARCAIHLPEAEGKEGFPAACARGMGRGYTKISHLMLKKKTAGQLETTLEPMLISRVSDVLKASPMKTLLEHEISATSVLLVPLVSRKKMQALMVIYEFDPAGLEEDGTPFFSVFARQGGAALENAFKFQGIQDLSLRLEQENTSLKQKMKQDVNQRFVMGKGPAMKEVMALVQKVVDSPTTVIIYGETGTGKELIANAIHETGPRRQAPLIKVNCAAIPEELLESELFGHEKGAFTGADKKRVGLFQLADKGSLFLDEIGEISLKTQTKLLRVLQEGQIQPLGSNTPVTVDVRVISATNKDLLQAIENKSFRSDLYYRLNVFSYSAAALAPPQGRHPGTGGILSGKVCLPEKLPAAD